MLTSRADTWVGPYNQASRRPRVRSRRDEHQNRYLRENCISRLFTRVLLMTPKLTLPSVPFGLPHCGVLSALNASHRSWSCCPCRRRNDLASERSSVLSPGPTTRLRGELP